MKVVWQRAPVSVPNYLEIIRGLPEYPARNDPRHPTYSGVEAHCNKALALAAPNAYSWEEYEACVRAWHEDEICFEFPTGRMRHGDVVGEER